MEIGRTILIGLVREPSVTPSKSIPAIISCVLVQSISSMSCLLRGVIQRRGMTSALEVDGAGSLVRDCACIRIGWQVVVLHSVQVV